MDRTLQLVRFILSSYSVRLLQCAKFDCLSDHGSAFLNAAVALMLTEFSLNKVENLLPKKTKLGSVLNSKENATMQVQEQYCMIGACGMQGVSVSYGFTGLAIVHVASRG